jgi:aminoglycoside phosphotransferase (APT) family kinase protein
MNSLSSTSNHAHRASTYYWKCDRPAAFHGTSGTHDHAFLTQAVKSIVENHFAAPAHIAPGPGQGNHVTFTAACRDLPLFIRIDDSPESDDYLAIESQVQEIVRSLGVPTPEILVVDASRAKVPFAWQIMRRIDAPDINRHFKDRTLDLRSTSEAIGSAIASWQFLHPEGYGPFRSGHRQLKGWHANYTDYFFLHFDRHLHFLQENGFLSPPDASEIRQEILNHQTLLALPEGCLVHKDLAFWNILGNPDEILAFIDWDDAISGDPMDDFSLLACFHGKTVLEPALESYQMQRALPVNHQRRFWLHLLRNMLVKSVIRVGAGYFDRGSGFFLINDGIDLKTFTRQRLHQALAGLRNDLPISSLK